MIRSAAIAAAALVVALLTGCGGSGSDTSSSQPANPGAAQIVSPDSLRETASNAVPIYWAGERDGTELELSRPEKNRIYVRYLTDGAEAGDKRANFLTVGTYAQPNPAASLQRQAKRSGGTISKGPGNATVYFDRAGSRSIYLAYPSAPVEVEVFDPNFKRALHLVESGQIVAVE